ncbi:MAG: glycoside hydrolase family 13 protein [Candidatus Limiplasma sp.]|nr:glycoside hydrolase family 13 protein [Candidatus Limiplasma sp.]
MLFHDSHDISYREPQGGVKAGGALRLRFCCDESDTVILRTWDGGESRLPMRKTGEHLFEIELNVSDRPMLFWYDFLIPKDQGEVRYGNARDQLGGEGEVQWGQMNSYQVTVYDPDFETPPFLHEGVMYQIFPDRFYRDKGGMKGRLRKIKAAHPEAAFHESWDEAPTLDPDPENGDNRALDFFGGTLSGIRQKLDYLSALGVSVLYLNPIFRARTNHRYDTGSYEEIDPIVGDDAAFDSLIIAAHARGFTILLDGVFSHTGADSQYFNRFGYYDSLGAYQSRQSPYFSWYRFEEFPEKYNAWWGIYTLPAVEKENPEYKHYLLNEKDGIVPRWVRRGTGGWRLDVADELPVPLLQDMRKAVKAAGSQAVLIGEVWEDASNKVSYGVQRSYCLGDTVDSVMNYPLRRAVIDFFTGHCNAHHLRRVILHQREVYPAPFYYALMNLLGSHDRVRILNAMAGYDQEGAIQLPREESQKIRLTKLQLSQAKKRHLEALKLICALPGTPSLYYGDEMGMQGMADPWNRAPMVWEEGDATHWSAVSALLNERRERRVLQTGFVDVEALGDDVLRIRRFAVEGKDVFGNVLTEKDAVIRIARKG